MMKALFFSILSLCLPAIAGGSLLQASSSSSAGEDVTACFTSSVFKQELLRQGIVADTGRILRSEVAGVTRLQLRTRDPLQSLAGIECFTALKDLELRPSYGYYRRMDTLALDVSLNSALETLEISNFYVGKRLDMSSNKQLRMLRCRTCRLQELVLDCNPNLEILTCPYNDLQKIDLSHNLRLRTVDVGHQSVEGLDGDPRRGVLTCLLLPDNRNDEDGMRDLKCGWNQLKELDLDRLPYLTRLDCRWCCFTELDLSAYPRLQDVACEGNYLPALDLSHQLHLRRLVCGNQGSTGGGVMEKGKDYHLLKSLILPVQTENSDELCLQVLSYAGARFAAPLDISLYPSLRTLDCSDNELTTLNISANQKLWMLDCTKNKISHLNLKENPALRRIKVDHITIELSDDDAR